MNKKIVFVFAVLFLSACGYDNYESSMATSQDIDYPKIYSTVDVDMRNFEMINITCWTRDNFTGEYQRFSLGNVFFEFDEKAVMNTQHGNGKVIDFRKTYLPDIKIFINYRTDFQDLNLSENWADCRFVDPFKFKYSLSDSTGYKKEDSFSCFLDDFDISCMKEDKWNCALVRYRSERTDNMKIEEYLRDCMMDQTEFIGD